LPAHASILTGRLPPDHGVRCNGKFRLPESASTLAEILKAEGFATGAVLGAVPLEAGFGLEQGFDLYDDDFEASEQTRRIREQFGWKRPNYERSAEDVSRLAMEWLEGREPRWFLLAHYFDPHFPYETKPGFAHLNELYDVEIAYADHHLGRLLEAVARAPGRTLVVFTADHGESFGEHDLYFHGRSLYDAELRVPLVVALPGVARAGHRVATPVSHVDLMPSLLELLGIAVPPGLGGRSLVPAIQGGEVVARPIYGESLVHWFEVDDGVQIHALVDGRYKWIERQETLGDSGEVHTRRELYDLEADPGESVNLATLHGERAERMQTALLETRTRLEREGSSPEPREPDAALLEKLRALGYLGEPESVQ
jgi:arylsulfatase A-like enzyme